MERYGKIGMTILYEKILDNVAIRIVDDENTPQEIRDELEGEITESYFLLYVEIDGKIDDWIYADSASGMSYIEWAFKALANIYETGKYNGRQRMVNVVKKLSDSIGKQ